MKLTPSNVVTGKNGTYTAEEHNSNFEFAPFISPTAVERGTQKQLEGLTLYAGDAQRQDLAARGICNDCVNQKLCKFKDTVSRNINRINKTVAECETLEETNLIAANYSCKYYKINSAYRK